MKLNNKLIDKLSEEDKNNINSYISANSGVSYGIIGWILLAFSIQNSIQGMLYNLPRSYFISLIFAALSLLFFIAMLIIDYRVEKTIFDKYFKITLKKRNK